MRVLLLPCCYILFVAGYDNSEAVWFNGTDLVNQCLTKQIVAADKGIFFKTNYHCSNINFMYTKEQVSGLRQRFWTVFGQYMKPVPGANGEMVNWINYKTGIRNIFFRMEAGKDVAMVSIELRHTTEEERLRYFDQLLALKNLLHQSTGFQFTWQAAVANEHGQVISRISNTVTGVSLLNEDDWPAIISFLKPRIMALDVFWNLVRDAFE